MMSDLPVEVRYALRSLACAPVWAFSLILTIALGIGSTASVQGFVRGLLTTDLPIPASDTVVSLFGIDREGRAGPLPFADIAALGQRRDLFEALGAVRESQERVIIGTRSSLLPVATVTADLFAVLPLPVVEGVVLSHRMRYAEFDARVNVIDEALAVGRVATRVGGVAPYWLEGLFRGRKFSYKAAFQGTPGRGRRSRTPPQRTHAGSAGAEPHRPRE